MHYRSCTSVDAPLLAPLNLQLIAGYALFRREGDLVTLRQLFVVADRGRQGLAREALGWLWQNAWRDVRSLRVEVLIGNTSAEDFWRAVGFGDSGLILESASPPAIQPS